MRVSSHLSASTLYDPGLLWHQQHPSLGGRPSARRQRVTFGPGRRRATPRAALHPCPRARHHSGDEYTEVIIPWDLFIRLLDIFDELLRAPILSSSATVIAQAKVKLTDCTLARAVVTLAVHSLVHRPVSISWIIGSMVSSCYGFILRW